MTPISSLAVQLSYSRAHAGLLEHFSVYHHEAVDSLIHWHTVERLWQSSWRQMSLTLGIISDFTRARCSSGETGPCSTRAIARCGRISLSCGGQRTAALRRSARPSRTMTDSATRPDTWKRLKRSTCGSPWYLYRFVAWSRCIFQLHG